MTIASRHMDYDAQDFMPALFIGYAHWPYTLEVLIKKKKKELGIEDGKPADWSLVQQAQQEAGCIDFRPGVYYTTHQTAGVACHHVELFGVFYRIAYTPLAQLCQDTCHMDPVSFDVLRQYDDWLSVHGLRMGGYGYEKLAEGYISGIDPQAAWEYILKHKSKALLHGSEYEYTSYNEIVRAIEDSIEMIPVEHPWHRAVGAFRSPIAAIVYENCD